MFPFFLIFEILEFPLRLVKNSPGHQALSVRWWCWVTPHRTPLRTTWTNSRLTGEKKPRNSTTRWACVFTRCNALTMADRIHFTANSPNSHVDGIWSWTSLLPSWIFWQPFVIVSRAWNIWRCLKQRSRRGQRAPGWTVTCTLFLTPWLGEAQVPTRAVQTTGDWYRSILHDFRSVTL